MSINQAFSAINRADFLRNSEKKLATYDHALSIGYGQTNSQPTTVKMMLSWLDVKKDQKILDVGSGSGWTTALLSNLVGESGFVHAVEIVPELVKFGEANCAKYNLKNVAFHNAGKKLGFPKYAPYDRILVSAASSQLPQSLVKQLKEGGKMVVPVNYDILEILKVGNTIKSLIHHGFIFVPLIHN